MWEPSRGSTHSEKIILSKQQPLAPVVVGWNHPAFAKENRNISGGEKGWEKPVLSKPQSITKRSPFTKRSRNNVQKKEKSKIKRLDMAKFAPAKAKRLVNLQALLLSTKSSMTSATNTMTRTASPKMITTTNPLMTSTCRTCKRCQLPCLFCVQSAPHPLPVELYCSDEVCDRDKQRAREAKKRQQQEQ